MINPIPTYDTAAHAVAERINELVREVLRAQAVDLPEAVRQARARLTLACAPLVEREQCNGNGKVLENK